MILNYGQYFTTRKQMSVIPISKNTLQSTNLFHSSSVVQSKQKFQDYRLSGRSFALSFYSSLLARKESLYENFAEKLIQGLTQKRLLKTLEDIIFVNITRYPFFVITASSASTIPTAQHRLGYIIQVLKTYCILNKYE